jgi:hypothetical protein
MSSRAHAAIGSALIALLAFPVYSDDDDRSRNPIITEDAHGKLGTFSTNHFNPGVTQGFFAHVGTNGRSCGTCHIPDQAQTLTPAHARRVAQSDPHNPLFAPVDGSDCPAVLPGQLADASQSALLLKYGLIRVQLAIPLAAQFTLASATNPSNCAIAPGDPAANNQLFLFRRPLPTTNLIFLSAIMWDGRETVQKIATAPGMGNTGPLAAGLANQANDATLGHAQGAQPIVGTELQADMLAFEQNLYTAQTVVGDTDLTRDHGGPRYLAKVVAPAFFIGQNDPLSASFSSVVFTLYSHWEPGQYAGRDEAKAAIGRGEQIFNTRTFTIANVAGLNSARYDPLYNPDDPIPDRPITGTCGTCHNTPNVGNHSTSLPVNIGVTMAVPTDNRGTPISGILDIGNLPVFTLSSNANGATVQVTDPARAMISGRWVDIGKTKGPVLRGLAARAPYFHNGSAQDLRTVLRFYDARFNIGLTPQEISDLVAFLSAL